MPLLHHLTPQRLRHYATLSNLTVAIALLIAAGWAWGTVATLQKNFALQQELDALNQSNRLLELQNKSLQLEQHYYKSDEYLELAVRDLLDKGAPGESMLILPDSRSVTDRTAAGRLKPQEPSNLAQWIMFFFGDKPDAP